MKNDENNFNTSCLEVITIEIIYKNVSCTVPILQSDSLHLHSVTIFGKSFSLILLDFLTFSIKYFWGKSWRIWEN